MASEPMARSEVNRARNANGEKSSTSIGKWPGDGPPLRIQIIAALNQQVMSASTFAKKTGHQLQNVAYHFRVLKEKGLIEEAYPEPVRAYTEKG